MWDQLGSLSGTQVVDVLVSSVQVGFMHISGALVGVAGRVGSAGTVECSSYLWPLQHSDLRVIVLLTWQRECSKRPKQNLESLF